MGLFSFWDQNTKENVVEEKVVIDKSEMIDVIIKSTKLPKFCVQRALDGFIDVVTTTLKEGKTVDLEWFGKFSVKEIIDENNKAANTPVFEASEALINAVS